MTKAELKSALEDLEISIERIDLHVQREMIRNDEVGARYGPLQEDIKDAMNGIKLLLLALVRGELD